MQIRGRRKTSGWPRVNCQIDGCSRGTTRIEPSENGWISHDGPDPQWVCGPHWKRIPKTMKRRLRWLEREYLRWRKVNEEESTKRSYLKACQAMRLARAHWRRMIELFDVGHIDMAEIERIIGP